MSSLFAIPKIKKRIIYLTKDMVKKAAIRYDEGTNSQSDHTGELSPSISERRLTLSEIYTRLVL